jgi:hypothetical protein
MEGSKRAGSLAATVLGISPWIRSEARFIQLLRGGSVQVLGCLPAEAPMRGYFMISTPAEVQMLVMLQKGDFIR